MYFGALGSSPRSLRSLAISRVNAFSVTYVPLQIVLRISSFSISLPRFSIKKSSNLSAFGSSWIPWPALNARNVAGSTRMSSNKNAEELRGVIKASQNRQPSLRTLIASYSYGQAMLIKLRSTCSKRQSFPSPSPRSGHQSILPKANLNASFKETQVSLAASALGRRSACRVRMVLCLLLAIVSFSLMFEPNSAIGPSRSKQTGFGKLISPESKQFRGTEPTSVLEALAPRRGLLKSDRSDDGLWRVSEKSDSSGSTG